MEVIPQPEFAEPSDPELLARLDDEPLVVHQKPGGTDRDLLIFVHGLGGHRYGTKSTWQRFPKFAYEDFPNLDVGLYEYRTLFRRAKFWESVPLPEEARVFAGILRDLKDHQTIILMGHSMGGLLCMAAICDLIDTNQKEVLSRIGGLILMATPQTGSKRVPAPLSWVSRDFYALKPHGEFVIRVHETLVNFVILDEGHGQPDKILIPTWAVLGASDFWVDKLSAGLQLPERRKKMVRGTHTAVVKPHSKQSDAYLFVHDCLKGCLSASTRLAPPVQDSRTGTTTALQLAPEPSIEQPFIGRDKLLRTLKRRLIAGERQVLVLLPGVGKSELATVAAHDSEVLKHFPDGVLWAKLGREPKFIPELEKWAEKLGVPADELSKPKSLSRWQELVKAKIEGKRMLMVIDDVWHAEHARLFFSLGRNCVRLVTTRLPKVADDLRDPIEVPQLDETQGLALLTYLAPAAVNEDPTRTRELVKAAGGLPLALVLLGNHLRIAGSGNPNQIRRVLDKLLIAKERLIVQGPPPEPGATPISLEAAINLSFEELESDETRRTLLALSIFRPKPSTFSEKLALRVSSAQPETLDTLDRAGFLEYDRKADGYTMHRTIAEYAREKLDQETTRQQHSSAYGYYRERCQQYEENPNYESWYRYENAEWRTLNDHRLYHLAHSGDEAATLLEFVRTYFDAFWWWGCFIEFSLCEDLLAEWHQKEIFPADTIVNALRDFQNSYPKETEDRHAGNWVEVESALRAVLEMVHLDDDASRLTDSEQRHVRGLIDIFLAEAYRFGHADPQRAADLYQEAHDLFQQNKDEWVRGWILYHFSDLNCERGELDQALHQSDEALSLGEEQEDPELIANAYRTRGDIFLKEKKLDLAADTYARATYHAFRFQAIPKPPDEYTIEFYALIVRRVLEPLCQLDETEAIKLCGKLHEFWLPYWRTVGASTEAPDVTTLVGENRVSELAQCMLPPRLDIKDLDAKGAEYGDRVNRVVAEMGI